MEASSLCILSSGSFCYPPGQGPQYETKRLLFPSSANFVGPGQHRPITLINFSILLTGVSCSSSAHDLKDFEDVEISFDNTSQKRFAQSPRKINTQGYFVQKLTFRPKCLWTSNQCSIKHSKISIFCSNSRSYEVVSFFFKKSYRKVFIWTKR